MPIRINGKDVNSTINTPTSTPMGTYHLAANPNLYEIQRSNNFELLVTGLEGIIRAGMNGTESSAKIDNAQELLRLSVVSSTVPHFTQAAIEVKRGNNSIKFAGVPTFTAGTIVINDYIGANSKEVLMAWQNLSYNVLTEKVGLASDYKKDCYLVEYTPDFQKVRQWKMHGCWISELSETDFNNENNEKKQVTCKIEYDRAELDMSDVG
jgi:hypothetical protein